MDEKDSMTPDTIPQSTPVDGTVSAGRKNRRPVVIGVAAVAGVAVTRGVGLGSGAESGPTLAANAPRPMLAVSTTAVPPAASLYSGSRAKVLPEKYRMGFFLLNIPVPHS